MKLDCRVIVMKREGLLPNFKNIKNLKDRKNMKLHFRNRYKKEKKIYGNQSIAKAFSNTEYIECEKKELNSKKIRSYVKNFNADICIVFGSGMIKSKLLNLLPKDTINIHLGLSPQYKGSATLFWPFYNIEPQFAGATFHKVTKSADAGGILHQCVPTLKKNDKIHDVGAKVVIKAAKDLIKLGFNIYATPGTADILRENEVPVEVVYRIRERMHPDALDLMRQGKISFIVNVPTISGGAVRDGNMMRRLAVELNIPFVTTIRGAVMEVAAIAAMMKGEMEPVRLQVNY